MNAGALHGVRVLDLASLYAAPLAATFLADFGADVVKVEPPAGDSFRTTRHWPLVARGKRSIVLDLRSAEGCERLRTIMPSVDVVVENYPPEVLARRGIGWDTLSAINPRLIMLSISCFGATGPYAGRPGSGTIGEAFGGLTGLTGAEAGPPMLPSVALGDAVGAMNAAMGVLAALYWRERSGRGQQIDASLYEPILHIAAHAAARWQPGAAPHRTGSRLPGVLRNVFATADGRHVALSASTPRHFSDLAALAGAAADALIEDTDLAVATWMAARTRDEVLETLTARRLPIAPVNDLDDLLADPHVMARASLAQIEDAELGTMLVPAPSPRLGQTPGRIGPLPALGADTAAILRDWAKI